MCFAEGVAACCEGNGFFIVHGHARECLADVTARGDWVRIAVGAFWVNVDQTHLYGGERIGQFAIA